MTDGVDLGTPHAPAPWDPEPADRPPVVDDRGFVAALRHHPAWWVIPALLMLALLATLVLLARGDLLLPAIYRVF